MPFMKELHCFDVRFLGSSKEDRLKRMRTRIAPILDTRNPRPKWVKYLQKILDEDFAFTDEWYRHIFSRAPDGAVTGEFTPYYGCLPPDGIEYVRNLAPDVKRILMIRDPVSRAVSSLRMVLGRAPQRQEVEIVSSRSFRLRGALQEHDHQLGIRLQPRADSVRSLRPREVRTCGSHARCRAFPGLGAL